MERENLYLGVMLLIMALVFFFNLYSSPLALGTGRTVQLQGSGMGIACSSDGQHVYLTDGKYFYVSHDHGNAGSWTALSGHVNISGM